MDARRVVQLLDLDQVPSEQLMLNLGARQEVWDNNGGCVEQFLFYFIPLVLVVV